MTFTALKCCSKCFCKDVNEYSQKKKGCLMSAPMGRNDAIPQIKSIFNRNKNIATQRTRFKFMKVPIWGDRTVTFCYCFVKCIQGNSISVGIIDFLLLDGLPTKTNKKKEKKNSFSFFPQNSSRLKSTSVPEYVCLRGWMWMWFCFAVDTKE